MSDTVELTELREGDVFRWSYREPGDDRAYGRYHCCSQIGVVKSGRITDTYWCGGDNRSFGPDDLGKLNLTYLGNLADYERAREYQADYYADADIMNLNHANSTGGNFYLRKGAVRNAEKMLRRAYYKLETSIGEERRAAWKSNQLREAIAKIEAGQIADVHL